MWLINLTWSDALRRIINEARGAVDFKDSDCFSSEEVVGESENKCGRELCGRHPGLF